MHELSIATWSIHIATVIEWIFAILLISRLSNVFTNQGYMFCYKKGKNIFIVFVEDVTNKHYAAHNSLYCFGIAT